MVRSGLSRLSKASISSIGTIAITDLHLLGLGMGRQTESELARDLNPWTWSGLVVMGVTGLLMFSADAVTHHTNPAFQFKMTCLLLALIFHYTINRRVWIESTDLSTALTPYVCPLD